MVYSVGIPIARERTCIPSASDVSHVLHAQLGQRRGAANSTNSCLRASFARQRLVQVVRGGSDSIVSDPPQGPPGAVPPAAVGGRLRAPMLPLGVHGHLFSSMPTFFFVRSGSFFLSHGIRHRWMMPKSGSAFVNSRFFKLAREPSQRPARRCRPSWPLASTQRSREDASARQCDWVRTHRSAKHAQRQSVVALSSQSVEPQQTWIKALRGERLCSRGLCAPLDAFSRSNFMLKVVCMPTRHRLSTQLAHSTCRSGSTNTCDGRNTHLVGIGAAGQG